MLIRFGMVKIMICEGKDDDYWELLSQSLNSKLLHLWLHCAKNKGTRHLCQPCYVFSHDTMWPVTAISGPFVVSDCLCILNKVYCLFYTNSSFAAIWPQNYGCQSREKSRNENMKFRRSRGVLNYMQRSTGNLTSLFVSTSDSTWLLQSYQRSVMIVTYIPTIIYTLQASHADPLAACTTYPMLSQVYKW